MKVPLKTVIKVLSLMIIPLVVYLLSYSVLTLLFILMQNAFPVLKTVEWETFRHTATILSGVIVAYLFFLFILKPVFYIIRWIQLLAQGILREPAVRDHGRNFFFHKCSRFLYKELLMQMQILTDKLKQNEADRRALEKKRRVWLAGITHDLKTPLSYIQGYASMISAGQYGWSNSEFMEFGNKIEEKSRHIKNLIDDLNISFQSEDGKIAVQKTKTEMVEFLRNAVLDIANSPRCAEHIFSFDSNIETFFLEVDTVLVQRALQNILINAVVHNPPETEVAVSVQRKQDTFFIQVSDNGSGMDEETQRNLFESYYRGTPTDHPVEGSGLGMAIAKQFVELHGGSIHLESLAGQGTSIFLELPIQ
ncbi:sensor histidine kinase [Clostridium sp. Marseille-P2415]|uniref:sensor histidine kinase n=1 Tax=Clostridium sp. Marseille-P2415 TaxID=1805471 RepID=UPI0009889282|nr:HAMP domain-containing sensor histidine kinase [Clostridium sp. Marseille-P2415]